MLNILLNEGKGVLKIVEVYEIVISKLHNIHWNSRDNPTQLLLFWAYAISSLQTLMHFLWKFIQEYRYKKNANDICKKNESKTEVPVSNLMTLWHVSDENGLQLRVRGDIL